MMKLVEESTGAGEFFLSGMPASSVRYRVRIFQGVAEGSGLPVPGLHRIEGSIVFTSEVVSSELTGQPARLKLQDGRVLGVTLLDADGRILSEGHGPSKCLCC